MTPEQVDFLTRRAGDFLLDLAYYFCVGLAATLGALTAIVWVFGRVPWL